MAAEHILAGWAGNYYSHPDSDPYPYLEYGRGQDYYDRGGFYFGGGWGGPNIVINIPAEPYYATPVCERVRICDRYTDRCWIERYCD